MNKKINDYIFIVALAIAIILMIINIDIQEDIRLNSKNNKIVLPNMPRIEQKVLQDGIESGRLSNRPARFYKVIKE